MTINLAGQAIKDVRVAGVQAQRVMLGTGSTAVEVWSAVPTVTITGTSGIVSRNQFHAACTQYGVNYQTVQELPFLLDTSQATDLYGMFAGCSSLTSVPDLDTSQATKLDQMFYNCSSLTDGNVRCIGRHPNATTTNMIARSGLTRLPFYNADGNPI